jgi:hypothetical protein
MGEKPDAEQTEQLLEFLTKAGFLRKDKQPASPRGGKPVVRWLVNPLLLKPGAETAETAETPSEDTPGAVTAVTAVTAVSEEANLCAQCGGGNPTLRRGEAWLHPECVRFWKAHGMG